MMLDFPSATNTRRRSLPSHFLISAFQFYVLRTSVVSWRRGGRTDLDESDGTDDHDSIEDRLDALVKVRALFYDKLSSVPGFRIERWKSTH